MSILKARDGNFVVSFGMECGTWVTVSRHSTKREYFRPLGDCSRTCVVDANLLCSRTDSSGVTSLEPEFGACVPCCCNDSITLSRMSLAIYLILAKSGVWVLEQPSSSMIWRHPRMQQLLRVTRVAWTQQAVPMILHP